MLIVCFSLTINNDTKKKKTHGGAALVGDLEDAGALLLSIFGVGALPLSPFDVGTFPLSSFGAGALSLSALATFELIDIKSDN